MARTLGLFSGLSIIGGLLLMTPAQPLSAAKRPSSIETSLLGIRILSSYRTVMAKYGQPTRIYRRFEQVGFDFNYDANGIPTGGIRGLLDTASGPGMGGGMARGGMGGGMARGGQRMGGMPGGMMGGPGMMSSSMGSGGGMMGASMGVMAPPPSMSSSMGGGGYQSMAMRGAGAMMGAGGPGSMGSSPGMGGGLGASTSQGDSETFADSDGFQWVYFYPKQELVYWFIFNKDGRVVGILERGRNLGQKTSRGLGLGDAVKTVYATYGWPDNMEQQGYSLSLRYPIKHHTQFEIIKNKVTSLAVFLNEDTRFLFDGGGSGAPGMNGGLGGGMARGGRMGGMPGGMMGGPGMMSSSMGGMMGGMMGGRGISGAGGGGKGD